MCIITKNQLTIKIKIKKTLSIIKRKPVKNQAN